MKLNKENLKKVLIINTFGIGDVLFTTPLIANLKKAIPNVSLGYVANRRTAPIVEENEAIDRVFVYERDEFYDVYKKSKLGFLKKMNQSLKEIKKERYDAVIDLSLNGNASFLMWWIGIKDRIGYNYKNRSPFLNHKMRLESYEKKHVAQYYLDLLKGMGISAEDTSLKLTISDQDAHWADQVFAKNSLNQAKNVIAILPGGGASWGKDALYKRWPAEKYVKLAHKLIENFSAQIILLGDKNEYDLCELVGNGIGNCIQLCAKTTLGQLAAIMAKSTLVIVNDGGPLHVAVAAKTRTVSIFGPVDDLVYGPYPAGDHVVIKKNLSCQPCYRNFRMADCHHLSCLNTISVEDVYQEIEKIL